MSSVIRPSGPLPPRVYWVRRLLLLVVVLVLVGALWWLVSGLGDAQPNSPVAGPTTSAAQPNPPAQTSGGPTADQNSSDHRRHHHRQHKPRHAGHHHHSRRPPLAVPSGPCAPADVSIAVSTDNASQGDATTTTLSLTSTSTPACTLEITSSSLVLRIVSENGMVWTSDDCPDDIPARQVVVRTDPATTYTFAWDGRESVEGCTSPGPVPDPGTYRVEVALLGGNVYEGSFRIRS